VLILRGGETRLHQIGFHYSDGGFEARCGKRQRQAQFLVGKMYDKGEGGQQSYTEALKWYRLSAGQEESRAEKAIGDLYDEGHGVSKNMSEAIM
jgi:uncharacterized protein